MLKTRYLFLKRLYPNDVIIFIRHHKYLSYGYDYYILKLLDYKNNFKILEEYHINYLVIDNLTIINHVTYMDNKYLEYLYKGLLINYVK